MRAPRVIQQVKESLKNFFVSPVAGRLPICGYSDDPKSGSPQTSPQQEYPVLPAAEFMNAAVLHEIQGKFSLEKLLVPRPKTGEVLLKVRACGVCHTDLHVKNGDQAFPMPCVLGHEVTGEIIEHGPGTDSGTISRIPVGSRAVGAFIMPCGGCHFCSDGMENLCSQFFTQNRAKGALYDGKTRLFSRSSRAPVSMYSMGGLAEYCVVPSSAVTQLPSSVPFVDSAILGCALFTAYGALRNAADLKAGQTIAVLGVGGVGSSCVQLAKAFGASRIIAVDRDQTKLDAAVKLGATHTVLASSDSAIEEIRSITGGLGPHVVVEAIGKAATFEMAISCVRDGGRAVMVGIASRGVTAKVEITKVVRKNVSVLGSYGAKARRDLPAVVGLAESGLLDVSSIVSERHSLTAVNEVYDRLAEGKIIGRAVIDMELP